MNSEKSDQDFYKDRAAREIALAQATGAKAHASADNKTVYVERRDGSKETVRIPAPSQKPH